MSSVFPTAYFGSIAYFKAICSHKEVTTEIFETYTKQTLRNRTLINTANGHLRLSIPVKKPNGSKSRTNEIILSDQGKWRAEHWRAIKTAYKSSPYFDFYGIEVEELIYSNKNRLVEFNQNITLRILQWLDIDVDIKVSSSYLSRDLIDFKNEINNKAYEAPPYIQVFNTEPYRESLSILDAIFNEGPMARCLLLK